MLIDTHCHLAAPDFDSDRTDVIQRARDVGVVAAIVMGENFEDNLRVLEIAARYSPFLLPALGHHPWQLKQTAGDVAKTLRLLEENRADIVAIGEVGLDYRAAQTEEERAGQRSVFRDFIEASLQFDLPLSCHVRSAGHYVLDLLREMGAQRAVLHAFDGKARYAIDGSREGFAFSIPATVLVSRQKEKLVTALPESALLLESDAPALPPERDKRNEPAVLTQSLAKIAELRGQSLEEVARCTCENACRIFGIELEATLSDEHTNIS